MKEDDPTAPHLDRRPALATETLCVRVLEGPDRGAEQAVEAGETLSIGTATGNQLTLTDPTVSRYHLDLAADPAGVLVRDNGSTNGTQAKGIAVREAVVPVGTVLTLGSTKLELGKSQGDGQELYAGSQLCGVYGRSPQMRRLMTQLQRLGPSEASVLLLGESGTGKEMLSTALHELSPRAHGPLVTVDCGALTPTLIASELFGHERGAFTGADRQHVGALERASGGTLVLDEIGELPKDLQPMLLGALERRRFRRVGGKADIQVDVRIVSATHRDLRKDVNSGHFRLDLYYRLAVVVLKVPSLRDRPSDIPGLVRRFLADAGVYEVAEVFSESQLQALAEHHWPGNVRELRNLVEATLALGSPPEPLSDPPAPNAGAGAAGPWVSSGALEAPYKEARAAVLRDFESAYLGLWLERSGGNVAKTARSCGIDRSHLFQMLRRHGLR